MTSGGDTESAGDPFRLLEEAGRLGASLAGRIAEDFRRLGAHGDAPDGSPSRVNSAAAAELRSSLRMARLDLERAADDVLTTLGSAADTYAGWADRAADALGAADGAGCQTLSVEASPGAVTVADLWVHNTTLGPSGRIDVHVSPLLTSSGEMSTIRVDVEPELVVVDAGTSARLVVEVRVDEATPPGAHHGLILLHDLPDSVVHVRVNVGRVRP
ncbi:hypothetical protein [Ilumatobacter nonamiensis]|uniref:hypothetical protein n=1 Tax=Ilumatobacter nonamiensis TaxID=467093 RepID=UPI0003492247|nr:hypothetical protein [Ilumatobacter nonamiensis]